jgi:hypothetical protein
MIEFNESEMKKKIANNYDSWKNANCIGANDNETIAKLCNFVDTFNVRPFVKRDLKRYIKKHSYWATNGLLTGQTADEFKEMTEMSEQLELTIN